LAALGIQLPEPITVAPVTLAPTTDVPAAPPAPIHVEATTAIPAVTVVTQAIEEKHQQFLKTREELRQKHREEMEDLRAMITALQKQVAGLQSSLESGNSAPTLAVATVPLETSTVQEVPMMTEALKAE
jgi:hypothetical protein